VTVTLRLDGPVSRFVSEQTRLGGFESEAAYIKSMLEAEELRGRILSDSDASLRLRGLIKDGLESGPATEFTAADWADLESQVTRRPKAAHK
jgi:Arc/MetJ-type ribon-helix-helix transcriptional regulator